MKNFFIQIFIAIFIFQTVYINEIFCSAGDRSQFYLNCRENCVYSNCTRNGQNFANHPEIVNPQTKFDRILGWTCSDECKYACMWKTTKAFLARKWQVPQFHGKWPFLKFLGFQEPASVLFSLMNLFAHLHQLYKFRKEVDSDSPCYRLWHIFALVCINGWIWSIAFHARDYPITEFLDYASAYSIVLVSCYSMAMRVLYKQSWIIRAFISLSVFSFYMNYFTYLSITPFDYAFNMTANIVTGVIGGFGWVLWYIFVRKTRPYAWKILLFNILLAGTLLLEVRDFPPLFWTFDAHSLWHLSTVPLIFIFYSFITDDCKSLKKEKLKNSTKKII